MLDNFLEIMSEQPWKSEPGGVLFSLCACGLWEDRGAPLLPSAKQ